MKRWLKRITLLAVLIGAGWLYLLLTTAWGLGYAVAYLDDNLPGSLTVQEKRGALLGPMTLNGVQYRDETIAIQIDSLRLDWQVKPLLRKIVRVTALQADGVRIVELKAADTPVDTRMALPWRIEVNDARVNRLSYTAADQPTVLAIDNIQLRAQAEATTLQLQHLAVTAYAAKLQVSGVVGLHDEHPLQLKTDWQYRLAETGELQGRGELHGDLNKLSLQQQLSGAVVAELRAELYALRTDLRWKGHLQLNNVALQSLAPNAPAATLRGTFKGEGDLQRLRTHGELRAVAAEFGDLFARVKFASDDRLVTYRVEAQGDWREPRYPALQFAVEANGDARGLHLKRIYAELLEGQLRANAEVRWQPPWRVSANVSLNAINPAPLVPDWPGQIGARFSLEATPINDRPRIKLEVSALSGSLRGYPLAGNGKLDWQPTQIVIESAQIQLGEAQASAQGKFAEQWDVRWKLQAANLNALWPDLSGEVTAHGRVQGKPTLPDIQAQLSANQLSYADYRIASVSAQIDAGLDRDRPLQIFARADGVDGTAGRWQNALLRVNGSTAAHDAQLQLQGELMHVQSRFSGAYHAQRWDGRLTALQLKHRSLGQWDLADPTELQFARKQARIEPLCLVNRPSRLCVHAHWRDPQGSLVVQGKQLPLRLLQDWLPNTLNVQGEADLNTTLQIDSEGRMAGQAEIATAAGQAKLTFVDLNEHVVFGHSALQLWLTAQGLQAKLHLPLQEGGGLDTELTLPHWDPLRGLPRSQAVQAAVRVHNIPAATLGRLVPEIGLLRGTLQADVRVAGQLGQPQIGGAAHWLDGGMTLPELGIEVRDFTAQVFSSATNTIDFIFKARSGDGYIEITGRTLLDASKAWLTQAQLRAEQLEVMNTAEALIRISPDIQITLEGMSLNIKGEVKVPRARLRPRHFPEGTQTLSRDVVIIDADDAPRSEKEERWKLHTRVRVQLGELVDFDGFGVSGRLAGNLLLIDEPGKLPIGQGEVSIVDGVYRMRGQDLTIRRGRLIFANSFIDEPGVDVEAVRKIDDVTAGVRLRGTLKRPELRVFSEPAMAESDVLSYLLTGRSFQKSTSNSQGESARSAATAVGILGGDILARDIGGRLGLDELRVEAGQTTEQTALVAGKYLSPKLYVRYLTGIVESSNIVQLRYQLSKRVQIQTEGGYRGTQSVTGGDIFFNIEY